MLGWFLYITTHFKLKCHSPPWSRKLENLCKGKEIKFIINNSIDGSCLNKSKLHLDKSETALLVKNFSLALKPNWLCNFNDGVADKTTNFASANNTINVSLLENLRIKNPKNIIFSHININSIRSKFDNLCDLISKNVDILSVAETKLDPSFPNSQFLIPGFHEPMRLDITSKRGGMLVYIKSSMPSRIVSNFKLLINIQVILFELNLRREKWLFVSIYKPPLQSNNYFLDTLNDLLDFYSGIYDNKVVFGDFNLEPTNPVMINFMDSQNFTNLIKNNTCFKGVGSCIDLILTNRKYCFKNTSSYETGISDHHHLIFSIMKTTFASEEPKKFVYRDYKTFSHENFKNDLLSETVDENVDYSKFEKEFIDTLNKHSPKKTKLFRGNQKPHVNKVLPSAIMKRWWLKNKANKTRKAVDIFNYKKERNLVVKINNECKREYFDKLNVKIATKLFGRLANHTSQTNTYMVAPKLH